MIQSLKHSFLLVLVLPFSALAGHKDLLEPGAWTEVDTERWQFTGGQIHGSSAIFDGEKTDPVASTFLVASDVVESDFVVDLEVTFDRGRYLGVYLDFGQGSQTGIWMATGHPLAPDAPANEVARGYIKTVENGFWVVRATGEIVIEPGKRIKLGFSRRGETYSLWNDGKLIAVYRKEGGYPPGPLQLRLTNAAVRIHSISVEAD